MRAWRKLHAGVIASEKLASVSDSAFRLFMLLIVAQDDDGKYPWTATKIRALTVGTNWERSAGQALAEALCQAGLTEMREGFIWILGGEEKNGVPTQSGGVQRWVYDAPRGSTAEDARPPDAATPAALPADAATAMRSTDAEPPQEPRHRVEESRGEESRVEGEGVDQLTDVGGVAPRSTRLPPERENGYPDWWTPMAALMGYRKIDHSRNIEAIREGCGEGGADPRTIVQNFCDYYRAHRVEHGWRDPVKALRRTLHIQIAQASGGGSKHARPQDNSLDAYRAEAERLRKKTVPAG